MKVSRDGGQSWATQSALTAEVLQGGKLKIWGGKADLMEVTEIAFDPYQKGRILVGTREAALSARPIAARRGAQSGIPARSTTSPVFIFDPMARPIFQATGMGFGTCGQGLPQSRTPAVGQQTSDSTSC